MNPKKTATMEYLSEEETIKLLGNSMISVQLSNQNSSENSEDYWIKKLEAVIEKAKEEEKERRLAEQEDEEMWRKKRLEEEEEEEESLEEDEEDEL